MYEFERFNHINYYYLVYYGMSEYFDEFGVRVCVVACCGMALCWRMSVVQCTSLRFNHINYYYLIYYCMSEYFDEFGVHVCSCLLRYGTVSADESCMSVRFNYIGDRLLALRRRLPPVLYRLDSATSHVQFNHAGYHNSCTMKSCSFAGSHDQVMHKLFSETSLFGKLFPDIIV